MDKFKQLLLTLPKEELDEHGWCLVCDDGLICQVKMREIVEKICKVLDNAELKFEVCEWMIENCFTSQTTSVNDFSNMFKKFKDIKND